MSRLGQGYKRLVKEDRKKAAIAKRRRYVRPQYHSIQYGYFGGDGELKFFDTAVAFNVDTTGEVPATGQWCLVPQDVTQSGRIGRKITIKSIDFKLNFVLQPGVGATQATNITLVVILDQQANGAAATVADVFTSTQIGVAMINMSNSGRFRILKRITFPMEPKAGVSTAYNNSIDFKHWYKRCNIPVEYSGATGAITELKSNNIFIMAESSTNDDTCAVSGNARIRFYG